MTYRSRPIAVLGILALTGIASGDFVGIRATAVNEMTSTAVELTVYRLYATFDSTEDQVSGVGGSPELPQTLDSGGGGFFQQTVLGGHQDLPATDAALSFVPDLAFDSYVTVGTPNGYVPPANLAGLSEHFNECTFNPVGTGFSTDLVIHTDAGWFILPTEPETFAVAFPPANAPAPTGDGTYEHVLGAGGDFGVLIAQLAVPAGNECSGDLGMLSVRETGVARIIDVVPFSFAIPASSCPEDLDESGDVGFGDVLTVIGAWGACGPDCPEDLDESGDVGFSDLLAVIGAWGACPG